MSAIMGRPTIYSEELANTIFELLANGTSLIKICQRDDMPVLSTVFDWIAKKPDFSDKYRIARDHQADYFAESIVDIAAENELRGVYRGEEVTIELSSTAVARNRLRMDAQKWYASKLNPRKYGDKTILAGDDEAPLVIKTIERTIVKPKSIE
jgi:hypothetical protein